MPKLKNVEAKIQQVEGFEVNFLYLDGADVYGNKENIPQYPYTHAAHGSWTVAEWIGNRFAQTYPGYHVRVFDVNGNEVLRKNTKLSTIRGK